MDATCKIQDSILVFSLVRKYVSRILGTYQVSLGVFLLCAEHGTNLAGASPVTGIYRQV